MKGIVALIGVGILILMMGAIMLALGTFRGVEFEEPHNVGSGNTSTTIVLANDVLDDLTTNIEVASSQSADAPVPYLYTSATHQLVINGLDDSLTRTLTVTYLVPRLDDFTDIAARFFPLMMILAGIGIVAGAAYTSWKH